MCLQDFCGLFKRKREDIGNLIPDLPFSDERFRFGYFQLPMLELELFVRTALFYFRASTLFQFFEDTLLDLICLALGRSGHILTGDISWDIDPFRLDGIRATRRRPVH